MKKSSLLVQDESGPREKLSTLWETSGTLPPSTLFEQLHHLLGIVHTNIRRTPIATALSVTSIAVSLLLLCLFLVVAINCEQGVANSSELVTASIYIKEGTTPEVVNELQEKGQGLPGIKNIHVRSKEEALTFFSEAVGKDSPLLVGIAEKNPLPVSLEVTFRREAVSDEQFRRVLNEFGSITHVDQIKVHNGDLSRVSQTVRSIRRFSLIATIFMVLVCALLIANSIRLTVYANRSELEIMQLVGARRFYMQLPFIFEGFLLGIVGSILALSLSRIIFVWLQSVYELSPLGELSGQPLIFFSVSLHFGIILLGAVIGGASAYIATSGVRYDSVG